MSWILFILGFVLIIISVILLYRFIKKGPELSIQDFNEEFERNSSLNPVRVELSGERKKIARQLNIVADYKDAQGQALKYNDNIKTENLTLNG